MNSAMRDRYTRAARVQWGQSLAPPCDPRTGEKLQFLQPNPTFPLLAIAKTDHSFVHTVTEAEGGRVSLWMNRNSALGPKRRQQKLSTSSARYHEHIARSGCNGRVRINSSRCVLLPELISPLKRPSLIAASTLVPVSARIEKNRPIAIGLAPGRFTTDVFPIAFLESNGYLFTQQNPESIRNEVGAVPHHARCLMDTYGFHDARIVVSIDGTSAFNT
eukprot:GFKZ01015340.1.p1 GENE.GFKZ01015340.1~~GFKZ01015340.1.p1  ORF type:complete len:218 (-),score=11.02 GFKZ01015340.1:1601-2254(-)